MKMSEPMLFKEWCYLCVASVDGEADPEDGGCFDCLRQTVYRDKVRVNKPKEFEEDEDD